MSEVENNNNKKNKKRYLTILFNILCIIVMFSYITIIWGDDEWGIVIKRRPFPGYFVYPHDMNMATYYPNYCGMILPKLDLSRCKSEELFDFSGYFDRP
uniref:Transmembrane protein n=1 Tax=Candidatus Kentrum sp. TC TaxID=2126339 RepID=A0A450ZU96_9GAMM|nr:MAG: hypothetical protein BECKTC1821F_GA0114240_101715 [Candidatus Kentron sp. TC]